MNYSAHWFGRTDFSKSMQIMAEAANQARLNNQALLLGFEYNRVITTGRRVQKDDQSIFCANTPIIPVSRGGLVTLHNPGQLIIYPLVSIRKLDLSVKKWVEELLEITKLAVQLCNIIVVSNDAGIFTETGKIASVGIDIKKGVSSHGIAINICNNLSDFSYITACGKAGQVFDKVENYKSITVDDFFKLWEREFFKRFAHYFEQNLTKPPNTL